MYSWQPQYGMGDGTIQLTADPLAGSVFDPSSPTYSPNAPLVYGPTDAQLGTTPEDVAAIAAGQAIIGSGVNYGPAAPTPTGAVAGSLSSWLNQHAGSIAVGSMLFVGLLVIGAGKR